MENINEIKVEKEESSMKKISDSVANAVVGFFKFIFKIIFGISMGVGEVFMEIMNKQDKKINSKIKEIDGKGKISKKKSSKVKK